MSWRERSPSPFSFWITRSPRQWPAPQAPRLDAASAAIVWPRSDSARAEADDLAALVPPAEPTIAYLPPVEPEHAATRDRLAHAVAAAGGRSIVHLRGAERPPELEGAIVLLDVLAELLADSEPARFEAPRGAWIAFPLHAGLLRAGELERWVARLRELEVAAVVGVELAIAPADRRRLADRVAVERWEAIFHAAAPDPRRFAAAVAGAGLAWLPPRPEPVLAPRPARNHRIATALVSAGELSLRSGRPEGEGAELLAAGRRIEHEALDLVAIAREGNLGVLDWLTPAARRLIAETLGEEDGLLAELYRDYLGVGR